MDKKKKIISFFLILLIVIGQFNYINVNAEEDKSNTDNYRPILSIEEAQIPTGTAGDNITLSFKLKNEKYIANDIVIVPEFPETNNPFSIAGLTHNHNISQINRGQKTDVSLKFKISDSAIEGIYPVRLKMNYKNQYDDSFNMEEIVYIRVNNFNTAPKMIIDKVETEAKILSPGISTKLNIYFSNKGSISAKDVEVNLDGFNSAEGFYLEDTSNKFYAKRVNGNSTSYASYNIKASPNAKPGGHELTVNFKYRVGQEIVEDNQKIYLNVGAKDGGNSNINIEGISFPTSAIRPGGDFVVRFNLRNTGKLEAKNIILKLNSDDEAVVPKSQSVIKIEKLAPGEISNHTFIYTPTSAATTMNYPISINIEYEDDLNFGSENKYITSQYVGMYVSNPPKKESTPSEPGEEKPSSKPKLIIDRYSFDPILVEAGENFNMNLSFFNTNPSKAVKNIKIFLTADEKTDGQGGTTPGGSVFTPVETSNTFYIDSIAPKGKVEKSIKMFTVPDAAPKTYTITANFEYEDSNFKEYTATELIGVPVIQKSKLDTGDIDISEEIYIDQANPIAVEFYNTGKATLHNLMVRLEGNFQKENASLYIGNFEVGASEYFESSIIPNKEGNLEGEIVFTYEDSTGQVIEYREPFSTNVSADMDMGEFDDEFMMDEPENQGLFKNKFFILAIIAVVLGIIGYKIYKKKKEEKALEEDNDFEDFIDMGDDSILPLDSNEDNLDKDLDNDLEGQD